MTKILILLILSTSVYADLFQETTLEESDVKLYKEIFQIQTLPIKNKNAKEWKKIQLLKSKISNPHKPCKSPAFIRFSRLVVEIDFLT